MERKVKNRNKMFKSATINTYNLNQNICEEVSYTKTFHLILY